MVRRQTRVKKRNRRQQNKTRNNRRQNKSLRRKRQSRIRGGAPPETPQQRAAREAQQRELNQMQSKLNHMENQLDQIVTQRQEQQAVNSAVDTRTLTEGSKWGYSNAHRNLMNMGPGYD